MNLKLICLHTCLIYIFINVSDIDPAWAVVTKEKVAKVATQLISSCDPRDCHSDDIAQIITRGSSSQNNQILHILNEKGPLCLKFVIEAVKPKLDVYNELPRDCENFINKGGRICQDVKNKYTVINNRILSLVNLMVSQQPSLISSFGLHLENNTPLPYLNTQLLNTLRRLENARSCNDYMIGEEREFIIIPLQSTILPYTYYRVKRESEKHYKAFVTLEFSPDSSYKDGDPVPKDQVHDYFMDEVKYCFRMANSKMKGPNGKTLEVVIEDARQTHSCMPKHFIDVGSVLNKGATAKYFHTSMKCEVTVMNTNQIQDIAAVLFKTIVCWEDMKNGGKMFLQPH